MRRLFFAGTAAVILTLGSSLTVIGVGDSQVTLGCDDGSSMTVVIDATTLTGLVSAVQAMLDYPAGLTCTLTQVPVSAGPLFTQVALADGGNPDKDYAVGGGQATIVTRCAPQETNFGLSAHVDKGTMTSGIGGSVNFTIPQCTSMFTGTPISYSGSHLGMKVDCLRVNGPLADLTATVTEKTGLFANPAEFPSGLNEVGVQVLDNTITGDKIGWDFGSAKFPCDFGVAVADQTVDHGNLNVHDAP